MANLDLYNQLKEMFEGIRDERGMHSNTATRIGNAFLSLLSYAETGLNFLRKDQDDRTPHNLSVGGRLTAETELQLGEKFISGAAVAVSTETATASCCRSSCAHSSPVLTFVRDSQARAGDCGLRTVCRNWR